MKRLVLLSALALTAHAIQPSCVFAQLDARRPALRTLYDVKEGTKLRITTLAQPPERIQARLRSVRDNTLTVDTGSPTMRDLPLASVLSVEEAYRDRKRGALIGVIVGVVGVYAYDFFGPPHTYTDQSKRYKENAVTLVAATGVGALIGYRIGWGRWRPVRTLAR